MKQQMGVIVVATVMGLAAFTANANERAKTSGKTPAPVSQHKPSPPQDATAPAGDTHAHRFFNAWGNGLQRGANAIGLNKDPLEGKLPQIQMKPLFGGSSEPAPDTNR
ncbi:hypothetical protein [Hydrogenophaga sp. BPS33]|uniref:hypothetical protein n=1 Tax=Hydrogenophaga sp. BPS33 TaxID=2651974 RepID=UPI00131FABA6|nr:hypothetical protein [Hydrogenophaga sp. BPS33]QHE85242.1 hypothetical protein F9K07_10230 [Hydrogenophaga sp. BPS33]